MVTPKFVPPADNRGRQRQRELRRPAEFPTMCAGCWDQIEQGDMIVPTEQHGWVHEECGEYGDAA